MNKYWIKQFINMLLFLLITSETSAQYIYKPVYNYRKNYVRAVLQINIFTCQQDTLINFEKLGYYGTLFTKLDDSQTVLFFDYYENQGFAMIDINNLSNIIDLTPENNIPGGAEGGFYPAYNKDTKKLYLLWAKYDPNLQQGTGQLAEFLEVVDPETGQKIKNLNLLFDPIIGKFSEDGNKFYTEKRPTNQERIERRFYQLILDTKTDEILESFSLNDRFTEANEIYVYDQVYNKLLVKYFLGEPGVGEGYLLAFNLDTKEKSKKIRFDGPGEYAFSQDGSKILISEMKNSNYNRDRSGTFYILDVDWSIANDVLQKTDGIVLRIPPFSTPTNGTSVIHTFTSNRDVFLIYNEYSFEPFENSYIIRISDGAILRGASYQSNDIVAKLKTKVLKKTNGNFKYEYKVKNKGQSSQDIGLFYVKEKTNKVKLNSPAGWITGELAEGNLVFFRADSEGVEIKPGGWQKGFSVKAKRLPHIANYYILSSRVVVDTTDIYNNSFTGLTLSPSLTPIPFVALEFTDTLISYKNQAYDLGWIKKEKVYNNFSKKLNNAKTKLENNKERKAKELLREFVQIVRKKWRNKKITGEALALLKFNAQYLKRHIGPPDLEDNLAGVTLEGVERMSGEQRRYKYTVHNSINNPDKLWAFYVKESVDQFTGKAPENWAQSAITSLDLVSFTTDVNAAKIKPDKKKSGFKIKVESLPVIMPYYLLVKSQVADAETILYNSITGFTLAPEALPDEFIGTDQIENLYEYVEEANDMNWINTEAVYEKLLEKVERISIKLEEKKIQSAKNKLEDFVDYVQEKYEQDRIRKEAKILLRQNANYIKRNL
jgi:hypothetical protein